MLTTERTKKRNVLLGIRVISVLKRKSMERIIKLIFSLSCKLHCKTFVFRVLDYCIPCVGVKITKAIKSEMEFLLKGSEEGKSCVCKNDLGNVSKYDLQIIVPVYNGERYLKECVESILSQETHYSFVVTIVNDGSSDGTNNILSEYSHNSHVRVITQENRGHAGARNRALQNIEADYIMLMDSDDVLEKGAIETLLSHAKKNNACIVQGNYICFWENGIHEQYTQFNDRVYGQPWGKVYRAGLFEFVCFPENYWFDDTLTNMILVPLAKRVEIIDEVVYKWRRNAQSFTSNYSGKQKVLDTYFVTAQLLSDQKKLKIELSSQVCSHIARQMAVNARRIATLNNPLINKSHFVIACKIMEEYSGYISTEDYWNKKLERALLAMDYYHFTLYRVFCRY